jgi:alkylated DNA repair dioxygenase AlkB
MTKTPFFHPPTRFALSNDSWIELHRGWLPPEDSESLEAVLTQTLPWQARKILLFGREVYQPRLIAWCGQLPYRYSGQTLEPKPVPDVLRPILARLNREFGVAFNHVLLNRYRNGHDSMGLHADNEAELGPAPPVATLSLGVPRRLVVRSRRGQRVWDESLAAGDLLFMGGRCQVEFKHEVPKQKKLERQRISLTFRRLLRAPSSTKDG